VTAQLCDVNVWLALTLSGHAQHSVARQWFDSVEDPGQVLFCRSTQQSFLRLLTNAAVLAPYGNKPLTNTAAWSAYESLLADDRIEFASKEPPGIDGRWKQLAAKRTASPKLWMDAYLAAFALTGQLTLVTNDRAFKQFRGLTLTLL
jgi:uncharacterized protein